MNRRHFLLGASGALSPVLLAAGVPVRAITRPQLYHWFGYYDKLQFDPHSHYALGIANDFQHRLVTAADSVEVGLIDLRDSGRWIALGRTSAWSWHQGCMLQWLPGSGEEVIWNDRQDGRFVARICNIRTRRVRTIPSPIYCLGPDARWAMVNDFARSYSMRPETGYAGGEDLFAGELAPASSGLWQVDLAGGKRELLISLADVVKIPYTHGDWTGMKHYFDHLLISPDGSRVAFLHRWGQGVGTGFFTRMFIADRNGGNLRMLDDSGRSSHYNWRDPGHILIWTSHPSHGEGFYLVDVETGKFEILAPDVMTHNGHLSYLPGGRWIVSDTSPGKDRLQHVYLFDTRSNRKVEIGQFHSPQEYTGVWRCDTTPRTNPDGTLITFDSPHGGNGRQIYLADISNLVK